MHTKPVVSDDRELSLFDILNIFWTCWFLNWDHLIANILSAQKSDEGRYSWVDFQPPFHTHLVQHARVLLPPLCPVAKGKKVMFAFILEVLDGDGPKSGSFWEVPKKHRRHPILLKKPEVSPLTSQALVKTEVPLRESLAPSALPAVPETCGHEMMTGVKPSAPIDLPPPSTPPPGPSFLGDMHDLGVTLPNRITIPSEALLVSMLVNNPFPREFDCSRIVS